MTTYLLILIFVCSSAFGQTQLDPPSLTFTNTNLYGSYNGFFRFWNWGSSFRNFDESMLMNGSHD